MRSPLAVRRPHKTQQATNTRKNRGKTAKNNRRRLQEWQHSAILIDAVAEKRKTVLNALSLNDAVFQKKELSEAERIRRAEKKREKRESAKKIDDEIKLKELENKQKLREEKRLKEEEEKSRQEEEAHKLWQEAMKKKEEENKKAEESQKQQKKEKKKLDTKIKAPVESKQPKQTVMNTESKQPTQATTEPPQQTNVKAQESNKITDSADSKQKQEDTQAKKKSKKSGKSSAANDAKAPEVKNVVEEECVVNKSANLSAAVPDKKEQKASAMKTKVEDDLSFLDFVAPKNEQSVSDELDVKKNREQDEANSASEKPKDKSTKSAMKTTVEDDLSFLDFVASKDEKTESDANLTERTEGKDESGKENVPESITESLKSRKSLFGSSAPKTHSTSESVEESRTSNKESVEDKSNSNSEQVSPDSAPVQACEQNEIESEKVDKVENCIEGDSVRTEEVKTEEVSPDSTPVHACQQNEIESEKVEKVENCIEGDSVRTEEVKTEEVSPSKNKNKNKKKKRNSESVPVEQVTEPAVDTTPSEEISIADIVAPEGDVIETPMPSSNNKKKNKKSKNRSTNSTSGEHAVEENPDAHQSESKQEKKKNKKQKNNSTSEDKPAVPEIVTETCNGHDNSADDEVAALTVSSNSPPIQVNEVTSTKLNGEKETSEVITVTAPITEKEASPTRFAQNVQQLVEKTLKQTHHETVPVDPTMKMQIDAQLIRLAEKKPVLTMETRNVITPLPIQLHVSRPSLTPSPELRALTPSSRERLYKLLPKDIIFCASLIDSHGENYSAMASDERNVYKESARGLQRKIRIFKESPHYQTYLRAKEDGVAIETMLDQEN